MPKSQNSKLDTLGAGPASVLLTEEPPMKLHTFDFDAARHVGRTLPRVLKSKPKDLAKDEEGPTQHLRPTTHTYSMNPL